MAVLLTHVCPFTRSETGARSCIVVRRLAILACKESSFSTLFFVAILFWRRHHNEIVLAVSWGQYLRFTRAFGACSVTAVVAEPSTPRFSCRNLIVDNVGHFDKRFFCQSCHTSRRSCLPGSLKRDTFAELVFGAAGTP